jgi:hypothetical protein
MDWAVDIEVTCFLTLRIGRKLQVFEGKVLRKISEPQKVQVVLNGQLSITQEVLGRNNPPTFLT